MLNKNPILINTKYGGRYNGGEKKKENRIKITLSSILGVWKE